jgi:hypothetical protein
MAKLQWRSVEWAGFDGRTFLTEQEWRSYLRRPPVRYPRRSNPIAKDSVCGICGPPEGPTFGTLQLAHRIPFTRGLCKLALTPDFLDHPRNLVVAHRHACNKKVELGLEESLQQLQIWGVTKLPPFLDGAILERWRELRRHLDKTAGMT